MKFRIIVTLAFILTHMVCLQAFMGQHDYLEVEQDVKKGLLVEPQNADLLLLQVG